MMYWPKTGRVAPTFERQRFEAASAGFSTVSCGESSRPDTHLNHFRTSCTYSLTGLDSSSGEQCLPGLFLKLYCSVADRNAPFRFCNAGYFDAGRSFGTGEYWLQFSEGEFNYAPFSLAHNGHWPVPAASSIRPGPCPGDPDL